jgi:hypothetical protein
MRHIHLIFLFTIMVNPVAMGASECAGVSSPDSISLADNELVLNGQGLRLATMLKVKVYVAALYVPERSDQAQALLQADQPWQLSLSFLRSVGADDMTEAWDEGFATNAKSELPALKERIAVLNSTMVDLEEGDTLVFSYVPATGTRVEVNGDDKASIEGKDFASALLSIWLGKPPNKEIKRGLLGGECG